MDQKQEDSLPKEDANTINDENWAARGTGGSAGIQNSDENDPAQLVRTEILQGSRVGDQRVRRTYAHTSLKRVDSGVLEATSETEIPRGRLGRFNYNVKRFLIGTAIPTAEAEQERMTKVKALAILSSDAISSVAYATEAILATLVAAGSVALGLTLPIAAAIILLLIIVALSYRQTIFAYPNGGGSYTVAKDNLGTLAGLIAAASLLIDYVLTVSVSVASGVQNLASLFTNGIPTTTIVIIDVVLVIFITIVNLRGVRESGTIFAIPTYIFVGSAVLLIVVGLIKGFLFEHHSVVGQFAHVPPVEGLSLFLILRSFAAGCSAMTGVEAISNGVPNFKKPATRNAAATLTWMAIILGTLFSGITLLATSYHVEANVVTGHPTVVAQIAAQVFTGPLAFMYYVFQIATLFVLVLAANTSYSGFPLLASLLARDNFLPHQFAFRGDRLSYSIGIVFLAVLAGLLLIVFRGDATLLINLYAVGVFMSFTLSQSGMVRHWWHLRKEQPAWRRSLVVNGLGAIATFLVAIIIAYTKFLQGAWIVVILIPVLVVTFELIHRHYTRVEHERTSEIPIRPADIHHRLIVPVAGLSALVKQSVSYARSVSSDVIAVHVSTHKGHTEALRAAWDAWQQQLAEDERTPLEIVPITNRNTVPSQVLVYIDNAHKQFPTDTLTVILPEVEVDHGWEYFLRNRIALQLKAALLYRPGIIVTDISPYKDPRHLVSRSESDFIPEHPQQVKHLFIVPIAGLDKASKQSLAYARSISDYVVAVHVAVEQQNADKMRHDWDIWKKHLKPDEKTELVVIESPYRSLARPLLNYIDSMRELYPDYAVNVILPEFVVAHVWEYILHNQTAFQLKWSLLFRENVIVTSVPQQLPSRARERRQPLEPILPV